MIALNPRQETPQACTRVPDNPYVGHMSEHNHTTLGESSTGNDAVPGNTLQPPTPRDWSVRYGGCPWLGGGIEEQSHILRSALEAIQNTDGAHSTQVDVANQPERKVAWYSRQLGSSGILSSNGIGHVKLSPEAIQWINTGDDRILASLLHSRILLFGELLQLLRDNPGITHAELQQISTDAFRLTWKTLDPIRKRIGWLRSLGYVQMSFDRKLSNTDSGESLLDLLETADPKNVQIPPSVDATKELNLPDWAKQALSHLTQEELAERKSAFGYIPRSSSKDVYESLRHLCEKFELETSKETFIAGCVTDFDVKHTSATSALYTLGSLGLVERVSMDGYRLTLSAQEWIDSQQKHTLIPIIHSKLLIFGELLPHLNEVTPLPILRQKIADSLQIQLSLPEIRSRIHILVATGAVEQLAPGRFRATSTGNALIEQLPLLKMNALKADLETPGTTVPSNTTSPAVDIEALIAELAAASTDSQNSVRFERVVRRAFEALGYRADHLGGPGKTDVLVHYSKNPGMDGRFIVDAKSSASEAVTDTMVQFPAIKDHTDKHEADFAVIVAPQFAGRITSWARQSAVTLLDISQLNELLRAQSKTPASLEALTSFLSGKEGAKSTLEAEWRSLRQAVDLLAEVADCLRREYENPDEETGGALKAEQIYFLLRNTVEPRPTQAAIRPLLDFLSSPIVAGTAESRNGWMMPDPSSSIARRLRNIADVIETVGVDELDN